MFFNIYKASSAAESVRKYEYKNSIAECKTILHFIKKEAKKGYNGIIWKDKISPTTITFLKNAGYEIYCISKNRYEIYW